MCVCVCVCVCVRACVRVVCARAHVCLFAYHVLTGMCVCVFAYHVLTGMCVCVCERERECHVHLVRVAQWRCVLLCEVCGSV